jgi:hypothetical protein
VSGEAVTAISALNAASEMLLAYSAVFVSANGLAGYRLERKALASQDPVARAEWLADAKTRYALAAVQRPHILTCLLLGGTAKVVVTVATLVT